MNDIENLMSTIAVVFPHLVSIELDEEMLTVPLNSPINVSQLPDGGTLISGARSQMEVVLHPNKVNVRELSGDLRLGAEKIPEVVHSFLDFLKVESPSSFGINFLMEVSSDDPAEWIGGTFLAQSLAGTLKPASQLRSNQLDIVLDRPPKVWTIRFQAWRNSKIRIVFNASQELEGNLLHPSESLAGQILDQGQQLTELLSGLKG